MGISVDAFLREYSVAKKQKETAVDTFIKKHIKNEYIGFIEKSVICDGIVKATTRVKDGDIEVIKIDSANRYIFFIMKLIDLYTDINIEITDDTNIAEIYDKLNKVQAVEAILNNIPESEYSEFSTILNMKMDDFRDNEYSITALLYNLKKGFSLFENVINQALDNEEVKNLLDEFKAEIEEENK